jgi:hypothetical protein
MSSEEEMTAGPSGEPNERPRKTSAGSDLIIPVAGISLAIYYFSTIIESPWTAQVSAFFVGSILILLSLILIVRTALALRAGSARFDFRRVTEPADFIGKRLVLLALTVAYIYVIHWTGFTLTTFVFLALAMLLLNDGRNKRLILVLSALMAVGGWAMFVYAFETRFPLGPFERLVNGVL